MENNKVDSMQKELSTSFKGLCDDYEHLVEDCIDRSSHRIDERIGLAMYKLDHACGEIENLTKESLHTNDAVLDQLLGNCEELEDLFKRIDIIEEVVGKVQQTTRELEKRIIKVQQASTTILPKTNNISGNMTNIFRSFSIKTPPAAENLAKDVKWDHMDISFTSDDIMSTLRRDKPTQSE